ncbi:PEPxxWA-CTERM sorting domain-containing protein [Sphingomonas sp. GB1N7]|uniref:PEPxxWA-CTERM sorting domain-containing protein n=1 Tax=Parasphingomonas caseinilytica TaxID=3096158 RepID=UPI002FCB43A3
MNGMFSRLLLTAALGVLSSAEASAAGFLNGGFENGTASGWTATGGSRTSYNNTQLTPGLITGPSTRSAVITSSYVDPHLGALLGSTVYSGSYGYRVEDTTSGGFASVISQRVNNYTDANIFFAWKSVLEGAHDASQAATMLITLTDLNTGLEVIRRQYNAASSGTGVDPRFSYDTNTNLFYTASWQIEQLAIDSSLMGHDFVLSVLGADCLPSGHEGYVYLDGFGAVTPPAAAVPEPGTWGMMLIGFGMMGAAARKQRRSRLAVA